MNLSTLIVQSRWLYVLLALSSIVGIAAGYGAAKFYPRSFDPIPFDVAAAAEPKGMAAPSPNGIVQAQVTQQPSPPVPVVQPRAQSVAERFNRTMKEQAIHGRIFKNLEEVRAAAIAFKDRYNRDWRLEKLGFKSPLEARQERLMELAA